MTQEKDMKQLRCAHLFEACADGSLIIYVELPNADYEPIRIEPRLVRSALYACGDALAKDPSRR